MRSGDDDDDDDGASAAATNIHHKTGLAQVKMVQSIQVGGGYSPTNHNKLMQVKWAEDACVCVCL